MGSDFHIFIAGGDLGFLVTQEEEFGRMFFPSLSAATGFLRDHTKGRTGFVVIHNGDQMPTNRIPLPTGLSVTGNDGVELFTCRW